MFEDDDTPICDKFCAQNYNSEGQWQACFWTRNSVNKSHEIRFGSVEPFETKDAASQ